MFATVDINNCTYGANTSKEDYEVEVTKRKDSISVHFNFDDVTASMLLEFPIKRSYCSLTIPTSVANWLGRELIVAANNNEYNERNESISVSEIYKSGLHKSVKLKVLKVKKAK